VPTKSPKLGDDAESIAALPSSAEFLWETKTLIERASPSFERFAD
jgi:hypothetical protein